MAESHRGCPGREPINLIEIRVSESASQSGGSSGAWQRHYSCSTSERAGRQSARCEPKWLAAAGRGDLVRNGARLRLRDGKLARAETAGYLGRPSAAVAHHGSPGGNGGGKGSDGLAPAPKSTRAIHLEGAPLDSVVRH